MKVKKEIIGKWASLTFTNFTSKNFDEIIKIAKENEITVTKEQLAESFDDWLNDYKSSIKLPDGFNLYHACGCNPLYFSFFYDPEYPEYKA